MKLMILNCSTRQGRVGEPVGDWFKEVAARYPGFESEFIELGELNLPFTDEPNHPRMRTYIHDHTKAWSARVDAADAFVFVTPEYNHGIPATLKNAIDYLHHEWHYKPVGIVSYGGNSGGLRAAENIKLVVTAVKMMPIFEGVAVNFVGAQVENGHLKPDENREKSAAAMLDELARWATALQTLRAPSGTPAS